MCSSSLHGTDVSDTGLYFSAACLSPFWNIQDTYLRLASHLEVYHGLLNVGNMMVNAGPGGLHIVLGLYLVCCLDPMPWRGLYSSVVLLLHLV